MGPNRPVVRLLTAMILAIVAYFAPSAVQAHEGHVHCGHRGHQQTAATKADAAPAARPVSVRLMRKAAIQVTLPAHSVIRAPAAMTSGSLRADDAGAGCSCACVGCVCGSMACCAIGIVAGHASLTMPLSRVVVLIPHDAVGHAGVGPGALRKPPRTLA